MNCGIKEVWSNFRDVDANSKKFIERLREAISIPSVSAEPQNRKNVVKMIEWTKNVIIMVTVVQYFYNSSYFQWFPQNIF